MIKQLLEYIEIKTKVTSLITFLLTIGVMLFLKLEIKILPTIVFFLGMFIFDMTTTSINNYIDTKTNGQSIGFSRSLGLFITLSLLSISIFLGLYLFYLTDFLILLTGVLCFGMGVFYTFGPIPISRQPYGEIISGIAYGYCIPFILIHCNNLNYLIAGSYTNGTVSLGINLIEIMQFIIIFMPPALLTSSIMLANNTCDLIADIKEKRFTLVFYLGTNRALKLMNILYIMIYLSIAIGICLQIIPVLNLLIFFTTIPVIKNIRAYKEQLIKDISDIFIIKNFVIILTSYAILTIVGACFY